MDGIKGRKETSKHYNIGNNMEDKHYFHYNPWKEYWHEDFNKLFVRWISISRRGEEEILFCDDVHIVTLMNFEFFSESREMETATWMTHCHTMLPVRDL
jgi:hypothetical protein